MAEINGIGGNTPNWNVLLNNIEGAGKTEGKDNSGKIGDKNLTFIEGGEGKVQNPSIPDIETPNPEGYTPEEIDSIVNKLGTEVFKFSGEDLQAFSDALHETVNKLTSGVTEKMTQTEETQEGPKTEETQEGPKTEETQEEQKADGTQEEQKADGTQQSDQTAPAKRSSSKVLFDVYQVLALLLECAQELKNSERDIRQAENAQVITSITQQAGAQRNAALTGMIAGGIVCLIQVGASIYSAAKTVSNVKAEFSLNNQYGISGAAHDVSTAQTELNTAKSNLNTFNDEHPVPGEGADPEAADITQQRTQLESRVNQARANLMDKKMTFESKMTEMKNTEEYENIQTSQAWTKGFSDITMALGNLGQTLVRGGADMAMADATAKGADEKKAEEQLAETKDLMTSFQDVIEKALQLLQAVQQAENQSMHEAIQA
ncbi:MAG: hypothetical protein IJS08_05455 [Victivallales bacterium]|nr:hypothetical protein [Victivallales bacterium]